MLGKDWDKLDTQDHQVSRCDVNIRLIFKKTDPRSKRNQITCQRPEWPENQTVLFSVKVVIYPVLQIRQFSV